MRVLSPTLEHIAEAASVLRAGGLVSFPTETVYGLGGDASNDRAVAAIFAAKARPSFNPLIVHIPAASAARQFAALSMRAEMLARAFWPGPLTMVLPRLKTSRISLLASAGLDSVALRVPRHKIALALLMMSGLPLAAPSANPSGRLSPTRPEHVVEGLGDKVALVLDGGACEIGLESTIVSLLDERAAVLRLGPIAPEDISRTIGEDVDLAIEAVGDRPKSPGQLLAHYAPTLPLKIDCREPPDGWAFLGFGPDCPAAHANLSVAGDLVEAAANLFALLRALDDAKFKGIAVSPVPSIGIGQAINDRLRRAVRSGG